MVMTDLGHADRLRFFKLLHHFLLLFIEAGKLLAKAFKLVQELLSFDQFSVFLNLWLRHGRSMLLLLVDSLALRRGYGLVA